MAKVKLWLGVFLVFVLGMLVGALGSHFVIKHRIERFVKEGPPHIVFLKKLSAELGLTPAQQLEIEKILDQGHQKFEIFREKTFPQLKAIIDNSTKQIKAKLNVEQKKKFDVLIERHQFMPHKPPPPFFEKHAGEIFADIKMRLNLTPEQEAQTRPIIEESIRQRHEIFVKHRQQGPSDISSLKNKMHELDTVTEKRLAEILSAQQMEKYRNIQGELRALGPRWDMPRHGPFD